jgi:hypothetical protein
VTISPVGVVLIGSGAVIIFDVLASLASRRFGFAYARASFGSLVIYFTIGFFAARVSESNPVTAGALAAGIAGLVDASAGWAASWSLGPGRLPKDMPLTVRRWINAAVFVVALAAVVGVIGGVAGRLTELNVAAV